MQKTKTENKEILRTYLRRLTNLTGNNRSLFLIRLAADQLIDLHDFNITNGFPSFDIIQALIGQKDFSLCPVLDSRLEAGNNLSTRIRKLVRIDKMIDEEKGSCDLHIGWPFVRGRFSDGTPVRCPLLFFPVTIKQQGNAWVLKLRPQSGVTFNKSFLLAYSFYNQVPLNEELIETDFEDFSTDSTVFRTSLYELLKDKLELNFNRDNFRDELQPFTVFRKDEFMEQHKNGELKLFPEAVLGIFPQAGSQLVPDYLHLIETQQIPDLAGFFDAKAPADSSASRLWAEEKLFTPFDLDAFQEDAIRAIKSGKSIVVQGPPGTGKSQLICNLISDAIANGKKVLLVCQKRAALDVVYERLQSQKLADFAALVHDFRGDRKSIFQKIAKQIDALDDFKAINRSIDTIQQERRFVQVCRAIDQITDEQENFRTALFDDKECGLTVKELYLTSDVHAPAINLKQEYQNFSFHELDNFLTKLRRWNSYAVVFEQPSYCWKHRKSFAGYQFSELRTIEHAIAEIPETAARLSAETKALVGTPLSIEQAIAYSDRSEDLETLASLLKNDTVYQYFTAMQDFHDDETSMLWLTNMERVVMNCFTGIGPEATLEDQQLVDFQQALNKRMEAEDNIFRLLKWEFSSKDKTWLKRVLVANKLRYNKADLETLEQKLDNRLNLEHQRTALKKKDWLVDLPLAVDGSLLQTWFTRYKLALKAKLLFNSIRELRKVVRPGSQSRKEFLDLLQALATLTRDVPGKKAQWLKYLTPAQIDRILLDSNFGMELIKSLRRDFESLCDFDHLRSSLTSEELNVVNRLYESTGRWDFSEQQRVFDNSLRLQWIDHIETKHPILRQVTSMRLSDQVATLRQNIQQKRTLSLEILLSRVRERAYDGMAYNRLNNPVTYRDLYHQVTKKRLLWPLRMLMAEFHEEIFRLLPCWMASPESVSAIFPMKELFDLVIFDEASQCFAERGIPAMYRGRQVVVAGDSKQLKPFELYQIRWDEEEEHPDLEVDSLLDLSERYLESRSLLAHYRSQALELIDFSNQYFYDNKLQLLPDRNLLNALEPGIQFHRVQGIWEKHTNQIEAEKVVELVVQFLETDPAKQIGIVTFNAPQQLLILELLEERLQGREWPSSLMVKNIENVQGDEKDIIIFSIGYAPDKQGRFQMLFGSLSLPGGENRLNVAVTRAREKVVVVCSFDPSDLRTAHLSNEGPKLLQRYLQYARDVSDGQFKPAPRSTAVTRDSWFLNSRIHQWASKKFSEVTFLTQGLPYADLYFKSQQTYRGIIRTDDDYFYTGLSVKDVFAYVPSLIEKKNWEHMQVFSRNYWMNRDVVEDELMRFIGSRAHMMDKTPGRLESPPAN